MAGRRKVSWLIKSFFILIVGGTFVGSVAAGGVYVYFSRSLPKIITVQDYKPLTVTRILGGGGKDEDLLAEFYKERRYVIPYDKIPEILVQAFISAEDDKFFEHQGINLASILRAAIANLRAGHVVQGGSTITQQVAKSLLLTPERSFVRKIKELILAGRIESNLSKQEILYLYLNQIYLGHGAYGVQAAARAYFNKDVQSVTLAEAAMLAGLPQAPSVYSPLKNAKRSKERQHYVLQRMYENKFITQEQKANAEGESIRIYHEVDDKKTWIAPYLVEHLRRYLVEKYGDKAVYEDGLTVSTPVNVSMARAARKSLQDGLRLVDKRTGYRGPLKRLKTIEEIEKELRSERLQLIQDRLGYTMFQPDGRVDAIDSLRSAGFGVSTGSENTADWKLLVAGDVYSGVVTGIDEKRRTASVMIGAIKGEIAFDQMKWANPAAKGPAQVVAKGDVVRVKVLEATEGHVSAALDQEPQVEGALFSVDAKTGQVLAMEGGFDFTRSEFNRAIQAQRQPGSVFKPIIYSAAIEKGFTPASIIVDSPIVYEDEETGKWKPANFEEKFYGDTTLRQALIKSRNVPTIKLLQAVEIPYLINFAKRLGLNANYAPDLSISLGSSATSLYELVKTYAIYPRLGRKVTPSFVASVKDRTGKTLEEAAPPKALPEPKVAPAPNPAPSPGTVAFAPDATDPDQALDPRVAFVMTHLMNEVVAYGTGHEAKALGRAAAGKTGTTSDYVDAWFMGFTPNIVTGVWVGFDSQKPIGPGETGAKAALPIWLSFMKEAVKAYPDTEFSIPPGVVFASIDATTGKPVPPNASRAIKEVFIEGTQPTEAVPGAPDPGAETQGEFLKEDIE